MRGDTLPADRSSMRLRSPGAAAALVVCATAGVLFPAGCSPAPDGIEPTRPANVVLIVLDTVRSDHLGCYGYERNTSPRIDAFAATATRYSRSVSTAPWTVPSHASMFTGKLPFEHGAHTFHAEDPSLTNVNPLPDDQLTLAEALSSAGYVTGAFVANAAFLAEHWKLNQGFDTYHVERVYADVLNERIFAWLDSRSPEPFFLFVNYIDAHGPYNTRPRPGLLEAPAVDDNGELLKQLIERVMPAKDPVPQELAHKVIDQYDTAIANLDEQVGALLDRLESKGVTGNTVVVITSDHGEYFGTHHLVAHSKDVYQGALRAPLLIRGPRPGQPAVDDLPIASNDLPSLILGRLPASFRDRWPGAFPDAPGNHPVVAENYFTRRKDLFHPEWGWRFRRIRRAVFDGPYKLILSSDGRHELYDLEVDPAESNDLLEQLPDVAERLERELREFMTERGSAEELPDLGPIDEDLERQLRSLGYLGN